MPHRRWLYNVDISNTAAQNSQDYSGYFSDITTDAAGASRQFTYPLTNPWSCESGGCNCSSIHTMSEKPLSNPTDSLTSTTESSISTEGDSYIRYPYLSPANTEAIATQIKQGLCPLATGASEECTPDLCGSNPPCNSLWTVPEIEECADAPCLMDPEKSLRLQRPLSQQRHQSPPPSKRTRREESRNASSSSRNLSFGSPIPAAETCRGDSSPKHDKKPKQPKPTDTKQAHSLVEKRYRENLNAKINELHTVLLASSGDPMSSPDVGQVKKSEVLQTAIDYVNQSQLEMRHLTNDVSRLNARVDALERLVKCDDCGARKSFDATRLMQGQGAHAMNGLGASYDLAATFAG